MLSHATGYRELREGYSWDVPVRCNRGVEVCDTWAPPDPDRVAIAYVNADGQFPRRLRRRRHRSHHLYLRHHGPAQRAPCMHIAVCSVICPAWR